MRILLADDHVIVRIGLVALLKTEPDMTIVGEADNGAAAVQLALQLKPDILLLDLKMPVKDGIDATAELHRLAPDIRIVILTSFADADDIQRALQAGACGALLKTSPESDIIDAIRRTAAGESVLSDEIRPNGVGEDAAPALTPRQREILASVVKGRTNRQIGLEIGIREDSVGAHLSVIYAKLGAVNRAEAIAIALRRQLLKI